MLPIDSTACIPRRQSISPAELLSLLLLLLTALVLTPVPAPALDSPVSAAAEWAPAGSDATLGAAPVCRASSYPPSYGRPRAYYPSSRIPSYYIWRPWGSPYGWYSPYGMGWHSAYDWGWQPYPVYPIAFHNYWHFYPPFLAYHRYYRSWEWYTYWMPWYPPSWGAYPPSYRPPHVYPRSEAGRQDEVVAEAPRWGGGRKWVPSPDAEKWLAENGAREEVLATRGFFSPGLTSGTGGASASLSAPIGVDERIQLGSKPGLARLAAPRPSPAWSLIEVTPTPVPRTPQVERRTIPWPSPGIRRNKVGSGVSTRSRSAIPGSGVGPPRSTLGSPRTSTPSPRVQRPPTSVPKARVERPRPRSD